MDPYTVLGVNQSATDDEVKRAYRELVKKYHPDKYRDSDLKDLAEEKLSAINKAYDDIQKMRKGGSVGGVGNTGGYSYNAYGSAGGANFARIRMMIQMRQLNEAERELNAMKNHNAEWHYLKGVISMQRGWADGAKEHFKKAVDMAPSNAEYRQAYNAMFNQNKQYQNFYGNQGGGGISACNCCTTALCADCCCECMGGDCISCC